MFIGHLVNPQFEIENLILFFYNIYLLNIFSPVSITAWLKSILVSAKGVYPKTIKTSVVHNKGRWLLSPENITYILTHGIWRTPTFQAVQSMLDFRRLLPIPHTSLMAAEAVLSSAQPCSPAPLTARQRDPYSPDSLPPSSEKQQNLPPTPSLSMFAACGLDFDDILDPSPSLSLFGASELNLEDLAKELDF